MIPAQTSVENFSQGLACFRLGAEAFAVSLDLVREITRELEYTPTRSASGYIAGLLNLRGQIVTVVDLSLRLDRGRTVIGEETRLLVRKTNAELERGRSRGLVTSTDKVGLLVDAIHDVVIPEVTQLAPPPANVNDTARSLLWGVCQTDTQTIAILDAGRVLAKSRLS